MLRRKIRDHEDARSCLAAVAASALDRPVWAKENGVDGRSLNAWRLALERVGPARMPDVKMVELVATRPVPREPIRYVVRCGDLAVEVDDRFDDQVLRRLISVVSSC